MPLTPQYILGRFHVVRQTHSFFQKMKQLVNSTRSLYIGNKFDSLTLALVENNNNIHFDYLNEEFASKVEKNAYSLGIKLDQKVVEKIVLHSKKSWLQTSSESKNAIKFDDIDKKTDNKYNVAIGTVCDAYMISEIKSIALNSKLISVVNECLGYYPRYINTWLFWSFADTLSDEERRKQNQTIDFHYDVHGFNFLYVNFYLTNTDKNTGAHVLVKSSHTNKKVEFLLGSVRLRDAEVFNYYGKDNIITIEGNAGIGFIEDTSCYHKALSPIDGNRLMLQLRYS
jgi:hypothetical protein